MKEFEMIGTLHFRPIQGWNLWNSHSGMGRDLARRARVKARF